LRESRNGDATLNLALAAVFFVIACVFVWRSFYGMRIGTDVTDVKVKDMGTDRESIATD
jgi:K(+)-stimulated pyrophosphate-energized sodium pump